MSQEDQNQTPQAGIFAGRRVIVVGRDARGRGRAAGCVSVSVYRESGIISVRQLILLQRLLPRVRLEQLFQSNWLQQRLARGMALERGDIQLVLRQARAQGEDWCNWLGDRINLASTQALIDWVLLPVYSWWESLFDEAVSNWRLALIEYETQARQLRIKAEFWRLVGETNAQLAQQELAKIAQCRAKTDAEIANMVRKLGAISEQAQLAWPNWHQGMSMLLADGKLDGFSPVPVVLSPLWEPLARLDDDAGAADVVQHWLYERSLCQANDHFYWQGS
ncbi:T3SS regulon anti-activator ExsD family protein [Pseudomonas gessardii]|uniref:T3SS regulon anti-activator ExsD domain-containing protein n=1 Tax=Pseudomonas gessardii TaxID=78544 RepID=UPI001F255D68|nr:T3SS regulon anti-activator ExsD domain-containing protein [Pseudomonas gessardii]MCF4978496.1 T3SS regulon anti-activator ExsD family protein [Pseudomonas gessardii]